MNTKESKLKLTDKITIGLGVVSLVLGIASIWTSIIISHQQVEIKGLDSLLKNTRRSERQRLNVSLIHISRIIYQPMGVGLPTIDSVQEYNLINSLKNELESQFSNSYLVEHDSLMNDWEAVYGSVAYFQILLDKKYELEGSGKRITSDEDTIINIRKNIWSKTLTLVGKTSSLIISDIKEESPMIDIKKK